MTAGAAQVLLKSSGVVADGRVVLAGSGPLLWLVAAQYLDAGVKLAALLDTTPRGRRWHALPNAWNFARSAYFRRGIDLVRSVRRRVRVLANVTALSASGPGRLESVQFDAADGPQAIGADLLLLHQGVVPDVNLGSAMGCAYRWNDAQACFEPVVDVWGGTTLPDVFIAGDAAGIAGAHAAEARGHLAALAVANALGRIDAKARDAAAEAPRAQLRRALRGRGVPRRVVPTCRRITGGRRATPSSAAARRSRRRRSSMSCGAVHRDRIR